MEVHLPFEFGDVVFLIEHIHAGVWLPLRIVAVEVTKPNGHKISKLKVKGKNFIKEIAIEDIIGIEKAKGHMIEYIMNFTGDDIEY